MPMLCCNVENQIDLCR